MSRFVLIMLVFVLVLSACQLLSFGSKPATQAPVATTPTAGSEYPSSGVAATAVVISAAYPYPDSGAIPSPMSFSYPYPESSGAVATLPASSAYPYPAIPTLPSGALQLSPVYPSFKDGDEVSWSQVKDIIFSGQVTRVMQSHDLKVYITLKDGRTLKTVEPAIDDVTKLIKTCGELCKEIRIASE